MPQLPADKSHFTFAGGLNSEVSPLTFPDGVSLDEQNFEMLLNGTRRRRRGLRPETGGVPITVPGSHGTNMAFNTFRWTNVAGNPDTTFIVVQVGTALMFATESETLSPEFFSSYVSLLDMNSTIDEASVRENPVAFAAGRGYLFCTARYVDPFYVSYDEATNTFTASRVPIFIRDFRGIDDGTDIRQQLATLTDDREYNLVNRGWTRTLINAYQASRGVYPAYNQIYHKGYRRATSTGYAEIDGVPEFNAAKLEAEAFGESSAPQGALILNPFDTGLAKLASGTLTLVDGWVHAVVYGSLWYITLDTATAHGLTAGQQFTLTNNQYTYNTTSGTQANGSLNGTYAVHDAPTATSLTFYYYAPAGFASWANQNASLGQLGTELVIRSDAYTTQERPQAVAYFAGRVWWAGAAHKDINDTIFFSQIAYNTNQFGRCYQEADPTAQHISALTASDGGTIIIPGMGNVYKMVALEGSLLLFCQNGIWEVGPTAQRGFFTADGYRVRQISDVEALSPMGVCKIDNTVAFTSPRGLYVLAPDPNSGQINPTSLSENTIQSLWNELPDDRKAEVTCAYDDAKSRLYFLYGSADVTHGYTYDGAFVFDARLQAFYRLKFSHANADNDYKIRGYIAHGLGDNTATNKKVKFFIVRNVVPGNTIGMEVCDLDHAEYSDFDDTEQEAYILTGYDSLGDWSRHRQAPIIHVFMKRTEEGLTSGEDDGLNPINTSSCFMQARWDWADATTSGKFGTEQQVYRHVRYYQPTGESDVFNSGYPVVVTRNKIRGRGRCLHLRFRAGPAKDCHILGWSIEYKGERKQ